MRHVVGHEGVLAQLDPPPPVTLLVGPEGVGKRTICLHVARNVLHTAPSEIVTVSDLSVDAAREIRQRTSVRPRGGHRAIVMDMGTATEAAANSLLKLLEEPPPGHTFLMHSDGPVLPTVTSRSRLIRVGLLSEAQVSQVCRGLGMDEPSSIRASTLSRGRVSLALEAETEREARGPVMTMLRAVSLGDADLLQNAISGLRSAAELEALRTWAREARTGRWRTYSPEESFGLEGDAALCDRILTTTAGSPHPRAAARLALTPATDRAAGRT